jgi:hypothetical protein
MNADSFEKETVSTRSDAGQTVTDEAQTPMSKSMVPRTYRRSSASIGGS